MMKILFKVGFAWAYRRRGVMKLYRVGYPLAWWILAESPIDDWIHLSIRIVRVLARAGRT
jgi:hypothetical protein